MPDNHGRGDQHKAAPDRAAVTSGEVKKAITLGALGKLSATLLALALSGLRDLF